MSDPILDFFFSLTKPRKPDEGDPMALSPLAGLVEPSKRPAPSKPSANFNMRQVAPLAGLEAPQSTSGPPTPITNAHGSVNPDVPVDAAVEREKVLSPWERALLSAFGAPHTDRR